MTRSVAVVFGCGFGIGLASARAFADAGHLVVMLARDAEKLQGFANDINAAGGDAVPIALDLRDVEQITSTIDDIEKLHGPIKVMIYNAGAQYRGAIGDTATQMFEKVWRLSTLGGFAATQAVSRAMLKRGEGTIIFTGASASLRGKAEFSAFAAAKSGVRAFAQAAAQELGPAGIHVAHVIVDGVVDMPATRERFPEAFENQDDDSAITPDAVAREFLHIHRQTRDAWTFETDLRPWCEKMTL